VRSIFFCLLLCVLTSVGCSTDAVYEHHTEISNRLWNSDSTLVFNCRVPDSDRPYDIQYVIRHTNKYPFYNLYVQTSIIDSLGNQLDQQLHNLMLFDAKTGEPKGKGLGDLYETTVNALPAYNFPFSGKFNIAIKQYMRPDSLPGIISYGIKLRESISNE